MSRDQKPGKMRVVGGTQAAPVAEVPSGVDRRAAAPAGAAPDSAADAGAESLLLPVILFLIACAIGGAAVALLGVRA
jgi:hypothetical protein